ncbi:hypothetical protein AB0758_49285 [Tolypothrix bouteillei VB521301_2]|uniref:Uncharacterized protein n=1 Tax=Tolypothrix bouteillei VB521301 TaxID=1479485 RepID=A0A0C1R8Z7_9CYAN
MLKKVAYLAIGVMLVRGAKADAGELTAIAKTKIDEKQSEVQLYSPPLENVRAFGCSHINVSQRELDVKVDILDQFGNVSGGTEDILAPERSGSVVAFILPADRIFACRWTYRGTPEDLRAAASVFRGEGNEAIPLFSVPAVNMNRPKR